MSLLRTNATSGFVDLATYDELEKYMYGGSTATAYFVRESRKATWFTQIPTVLSQSGVFNFGTHNSKGTYAEISRVGDYLLYVWLRVSLPAVERSDAAAAAGWKLRWTRNLAHNLIYECSLRFQDMEAQVLDNYVLDFWAAFTVPAGKRNGYDNMIGNVPELTAPQPALPAAVLNLPLPFFFSRDSGLALPTASLPYNKMTIEYQFRDWNELLIVDEDATTHRPATLADVMTEPKLNRVETVGNYALVSNEERKRMACSPRVMLIEQFQPSIVSPFIPGGNLAYDIRFSQAVKGLFFGVENVTNKAEHSNYTTRQPEIVLGGPLVSGVADWSIGFDPIADTTLTYENTNRISMSSDYYSLVQPYFHATTIPDQTGYHMYSYCLNLVDVDPKGSTNYGKLTNVTLSHNASIDAAAQAAPVDPNADPQKFNFVCVALNHNIVRISGGALGFPVL